MFHPHLLEPDNDFSPWGDDDSPYELMEKTANNTAEQLKMLQQMKSESDKEAKINQKRFIIQTVLSTAALIASVVAAVAAIIALL
nr:MAG TPA: hypothetical protein [Bacteriophage sp.]